MSNGSSPPRSSRAESQPPPSLAASKRSAEQRVHGLFNPPATATSPDMARWRVWLNTVIFEADTPLGRVFDVTLLWIIMLSVAAVMAESVAPINARYGPTIRTVEWGVTILFSIEYLMRLIAVRRPLGYATSFFGVVDLLSVIPTYLSLFVAGAQALAVVRVLRVLRIFRLLKLSQFVGEAELLFTALLASIQKIVVFLGAVLTIVVIVGAGMYLIEGDAAGFDSIPRSIYWAIVTLTTVGYGDIAPQTALGQTIAGAVMILGYGIIAVPTGIVSVELAQASIKSRSRRCCEGCERHEDDPDAEYCKYCGESLEPGHKSRGAQVERD